MPGEACPLPVAPTQDEEAVIGRLLNVKTVAVVGISNDPFRPSRYVSEYLMTNGYEIIPINPNHDHVLERPCLRSLNDLKEAPDLVLVFRRSEHCGEVARDAVAAGARGLWLQSGIRSGEALQIAADAGIDFVQDRCMMVEHGRRR